MSWMRRQDYNGSGITTSLAIQVKPGYGVAAVQLIKGNPDHAKRAAATSTNAIVTTGGAVLGSMTGAAAGVVAGPPGIFAGAVAGGSLGSAAAAQLGMVAEYGLATSIGDAKVKAGVGEISWKRAGKEGHSLELQVVHLVYLELPAGQAGSKFSINTSITTGTSLVGNASTNQILDNSSKQGVTGGHEIDDKDFNKKKKILRRVITAKQHQAAHELRRYCVWLKMQYPMKFCHHGRRLGNWLMRKRIGENGAPKILEWVRNEIDLARKLGQNGPIPLDASRFRFISEVSRQFILGELERRANQGMGLDLSEIIYMAWCPRSMKSLRSGGH
ncbi:hypothetical protein C8J55DRAFT_493012 [Lentinula edodes]|uniref:Uncharacterized protein n=1 Tax=Lentinula lateritia TaxID=40482 RepID=A0A9W9DEN1_9AGAR|nr:hypothetical protein C8J55DRAFT_493012 [Lentinula edodes]